MTDEYPLKGVTVLDLGQIYNGPYCGFLMAMAGADVIKVESITGEPLRRRAAVRGGNVPLAMLNSNKRDISLNLKSERGREIFIELVKKTDILIENFAPGAMDRLGLGPEALLEINPRLVYAASTGFGQTGIDRDKLAMDITIQASSGAMSVTGFSDGPPVKAGPAVADFLGGVHLYSAAVTALYRRSQTGKGAIIDVAMQDTLYPALASSLGMFFGNDWGKIPMRTGNRHNGLSMAPYTVYEAKDGHFAIICVTEQHWDNLLRAMGRDDLIGDERYSTNAARCVHVEEVDGLVQDWVGSLTREEAESLTRKCGVPAAKVRDLSEVVNDQHMHDRKMISWVDHPEVGRVALPNSPLRYADVEPLELRPSPLHGEHNKEVLESFLGLGDQEIAELVESGVIGAGPKLQSA